MLLDGEGPCVKSPLYPKSMKYFHRDNTSPEAADRIDESVRNVSLRCDTLHKQTHNCTTIDGKLIAGFLHCISSFVIPHYTRSMNLMLKNIFSPLPNVTKIMPNTHALTVFATSPPSVVLTAALTSSYGESSANVTSTS